MDDDFYKQHAQRVRDLADKADPFTRKRLLDLADEYDAQTGKPSRASRMIERPIPVPRTKPIPSSNRHRGFLPEAQPRLGGLGGGAAQAALLFRGPQNQSVPGPGVPGIQSA